MNRLFCAATALALVMGAPALADQHGGGQAKGQQGGGHGNGHGGGAMKAQHGGGPGKAQQAAGHGKGGAGHGNRGQGGMMAQHGNSGHGGQDRGPAMAGNGHGNGQAKAMKAGPGRNTARDVVLVDNRVSDGGYRTAQLVGGCPPGLAAKHNGCLPPGQAKKLIGSTLPQSYYDAALDGPYQSWYRDNDRYLYRMGDGYIYRVDRGSNLISALIPYVDRDYSYYPVGMQYPSDFNYYNVPYQYQSYYPEGADYPYRYGDGAIYRLDPQTQAVQSIVALLAGDLAVGQRLPASYGVYNVPLQYRAQYADTPNDWYRYNDGYIYRVDPTTQLVTALINALV